VTVAVLAFDLGTTTAKAGVYLDGRLVGLGSRGVTTRRPARDLAEQSPAEWLQALELAARDALTAAGRLHIDAIGLSAQSDSLVAIDDNGQALRPALLWMDVRGVTEAAYLEEVVGRDRIHAVTGLRSSFNFTGPKAAWLRTAEPDVWRRTRWLMQPKDVLHLWLTGTPATDPASASRTLVFDLRAGRWWEDALQALGVPGQLWPEIAPSGASIAGLAREAARRLGISAGTPVSLGAADRAAEVLGLGVGDREAMVSTGTATGVAMTVPFVPGVVDTRIATPAHAIAGEAIALLSIPTSGVLLEWLGSVAIPEAASPADAVLRLAARSPRGANGVVAVPTFAGARSFRWDPAARGALLGLSVGTTRGDLARAIVEGIAFEVADCVEVLGEAVGPVSGLRLTGGGHRSSFSCRLTAEVTGVRAHRYEERDAALAGAMLLAGQAIGAWSDVRSEARRRLGPGRLFAPDPVAVDVYREHRARYRRGIKAVLGITGSSTAG
jgi:xylulokinase